MSSGDRRGLDDDTIERSDSMSSDRSETYIDLYLLPVPEDNLEAYREQAMAFGKVAREHGALSYREFLADDPRERMQLEDGVVMTSAVVEFESRAHRDEVMEKVLGDARMECMEGGPQLADMSRMSYGGFAPLVTA
jgi:uncharacterized protein YbaA (DUF1428 family)